MKHRSLIVGAGPAGLAAAIASARRGAETVVFEKRSGVLDKACGEGIMPHGVRWLKRQGVDLDGAGQAFRGIRYIDGSRALQGSFLGAAGLGVRRLALSERLLDRARRLGVHLERGASVDAVGTDERGVWVEVDGNRVHGTLGVGADGLHGRVATQLSGQLRPKPVPRPRFGIRFHVQTPPWSDHVEVHWSNRGEAYVTPVGPDEIGVAFLSAERPLKTRALLEHFPLLAQALRGTTMSSEPRGAGPLRAPTRIRRKGAFGLVGDAAGYVDACTGEGLSLGFATAEAWVACALAGRPWQYAFAHRRIMLRYALATRAVLLLGRAPTLRRAAFGLFERFPSAFRLAVAVAT